MVVSRPGLFGLQCCQLEGQRQSGTQNTLPEMAAGIAEQRSSSQSRAEEQQWQYEADSIGDEGDKAAGREAQETRFEDCWAQTAKTESFSGMSLSHSRPFVDQANVLRFGWGARSKICFKSSKKPEPYLASCEHCNRKDYFQQFAGQKAQITQKREEWGKISSEDKIS